MKLRLIAATLLASSPALAAHDVPESYNYLGIHGTRHYFDIGGHVPNPDLDDAWLPGLQAGARRDNWSLQLWAEESDIDLQSRAGDVDLRAVFASVRKHYHDDEFLGFEPYSGFTIGDKEFDSTGASSTNETVAGFEMGMQKGLGQRFILDLGVRPTYSFDNERWDGQAYAAINLVLGSTSSRADDTASSDSSASEQPAQQQQPAPAPAAASNTGSNDGDNDGVSDDRDQCPDTAAGAKVDETGCNEVLTESIRQTLYIQFETGKAAVKQSSYGELEKLATVLREYPDTSLLLEGHTDSQGSAEFNRRLSQQRADAARDVLVNEFNISADRIEAVGRGEDQPIASNDTAEGRAKNRRVETVVEASRTVSQ
ncbi:MAG: OmpA family protein [Alcanivoracaceae bacterium]|nr:OmpA family protein [Alcanivoracaceae bacterium]